MRPCFTFMLLLLQPVFLPAQINCIRSSEPVSYIIQYHNNKEDQGGYGNSLLREIAKHVLAEPWKVKLQFNFVQDVRMECRKGDNKLMVFLRDPAMAGDIHYRQFNISDVLAPSRMDITLRLASRYDSSGFSEQRLSSPRIDLRDSIFLNIPVGNFDPAFDTLLLRDIEFSYDSMAFIIFRQRLRLIDDYYAASALLDSIQKMADTLNMNYMAGLPLHFIQVEEINKVLERVNASGFKQNLTMDRFDPLNLVNRYGSAFKTARTLTFNYRDALWQAGAIPWDGELNRIVDFYVTRVLSFIRKSQWMDDLRGDIYQGYLDHYFDGGSFPEEDHIPETLLRKMYPDARGDTLIQFVSGQTLASYRKFAQRMMEEHRFSEAVTLLEQAEKFAAVIPGLPYLSHQDTLLIHASTEVFNAFVGIASGCILNQKYQMADDYLAKAAQYQMHRPGLIPDDSVYRRVYSDLFFMRNAHCDRLLEQANFEQALECYRQFEETYSPGELAPVTQHLNHKKERALAGMCMLALSGATQALGENQPDSALLYFDWATTLLVRLQDPSFLKRKYDSLLPMISQIKYGIFFEEGVKALNSRQFTLALQRFDQARFLSGKYGYLPAPGFDSLYRKAVKNRLLINLSLAQREIWASRFDSAEATMDRIRETGALYGVSGDPDFNHDLNRFRQKIFEQKCRNLNDSVDYLMIRADRSVALKNFRSAGLFFREALGLAKTISGCGLSVEPITDSLKKYEKAVIYQQNLENAGNWVVSGRYDTALTLLWENEKIRMEYNLSQLGCNPVSLFDFVSSGNNPYLILQTALFYQARGDDRTAFRFLCLLRNEDLQPGTTRTIQEQLAENLAQLDYSVPSLTSSGKKEITELPDEKWLRFFRESYLKEWNRLLRASTSGL